MSPTSMSSRASRTRRRLADRIDRAVGRAYARLGGRYMALLVGMLAAVVMPGFIVIALAIGSAYVPLPAAKVPIVCLTAAVPVYGGVGWSWWRAYRPAGRLLMDWWRAGRPASGAAEVWVAVTSIPRHLLVSGLPVAVVLCLPAAELVAIELDQGQIGAVAIAVAAVFLGIWATLVWFFLADLLLRPVKLDVASRLPAGFEPSGGGVPFGQKLLGGLLSVGFVSAMLGVVLTNAGATPAELLAPLLATAGVTFVVALALTLLVANSLLGPVNDLIGVTRRIGAGDLSARAPVVSDDELGTLATSFNAMVEGLVERQALHEAFGSYVDERLASRILSEGRVLEGARMDVTILFVDIREFTWLANRSEPEHTVGYLNDFFELVVPIVLSHGGHPNKLLGDGLLAAFGAPQPLRDHAERALAAAREITRVVDDRYHGELRVGVGLNSGTVIAGTIGGGGKLDYTLIGDAVNVASRVEQLTKQTGDPILLTESTYRLLPSEARDDVVARGGRRVRGKAQELQIFGIAAPGPDGRA